MISGIETTRLTGRRRGIMGWLGIIAMGLVGAILLAALVLLAILVWQGRQKPTGVPQYVALGSSFAAGLGLGERVADSPIVCQRSVNGYPQQLARMRGLSLVDMSCSGATTRHVLAGGQVFQGPQIDAIRRDTALVTLTSGGNDVSYVSDLTFMAGRNGSGLIGWGLKQFWKGPLAPEQRDFQVLETTLLATLREIRRRAPDAKVVVVTYPVVLPPHDTCAKLGLDAAQVAAMRTVGERLADATRSAARQGGAIVVDMQRRGVGHDACSAEPWVNGARDVKGALFHPTLAGAEATARAISEALDQK
uniref:SGNH/GDSL hydrolase family protein n=1 Tax=uncultured Sphingomonas sp. TaxID=158754 RepID=UPI0035CC33F2